MFVPPKSSNGRVDPLDILLDGIRTGPGSLRRQILRSIEEHRRRRGESAGALKLTDFGFSVIVLHRARMSACGLANHDVPEPDHSVVSLHRNAAPDANQQAEPQVGERHPHLSDDRSRGVIAWLMETRNNDIMARDLAKVVHIMICERLWQKLLV